METSPHLLEEVTRYKERLQAVNHIVTAAAESKDLKTTLARMMDEALNIVGLEGGTICLVTPQETLELATQRETSEATIQDLTTNQIRIGECLCGDCAKNLQPLILEDRQAVLRYATREATRGEDIRFHAAFPLVTEGRCVGVLCVFTRTDKKPIPTSLTVLETVTRLMAFAVERARLLEDVQGNAEELERRVRERTAQLEMANKELEAFSSSVSHDLRTPLRHIAGFARLLKETYGPQLGEEGLDYLEKIHLSSTRMNTLIESLLELSRITRAQVTREKVDLAEIARPIVAGLKESDPERKAEFKIPRSLEADADPKLIQAALQNLLDNAWKFTSKTENAVIELGSYMEGGRTVYYVRDNGVGFDMRRVGKLFTPFERLHSQYEFPGIGVGLATVQRIIQRHGGRVWAESAPGRGAAFFFTLP